MNPTDLCNEVYGEKPESLKKITKKQLFDLKVKQPTDIICSIYDTHKECKCHLSKPRCPLFELCYKYDPMNTNYAKKAELISPKSKEIMDDFYDNPSKYPKLKIIHHSGFNANKLISVNHIFIEGEGAWFLSRSTAKSQFHFHNTVGVHFLEKKIMGITLYQIKATNCFD